MMRYAIWLAAVSALLAGCTGATTDTSTTDTSTDTGDTGYYHGPLQISSASEHCDSSPSPHVWNYDVQTDGLSGQIEVQVAETGDCNWRNYEAGSVLSGCSGIPTDTPDAIHTETDLMDDNYDYDATHGTYDKWKMALKVVSSAGDVVAADPNNPNTGTTLWDCQDDLTQTDTASPGTDWINGSLAWMITMYDDSSPPQVTDCIIFGFHSDQYWNTYKGNDCLCFEGDGTAPYCQN